MSCPHGHNSDPKTCSQCLGVTPRIVRTVATPDGAMLTIDGVPTGVLAATAAAKDAVFVRDAQARSRAGHARNRAAARCSVCGGLDHNRASCKGWGN